MIIPSAFYDLPKDTPYTVVAEMTTREDGENYLINNGLEDRCFVSREGNVDYVKERGLEELYRIVCKTSRVTSR